MTPNSVQWYGRFARIDLQRLFKTLVVMNIVLYLAWALLPWVDGPFLSSETVDALLLSGAGAILPLPKSGVWLLSGLYIVAAAGLFGSFVMRVGCLLHSHRKRYHLSHMRASATLAALCLLFTVSCSPPATSTFLGGFNPAATLSRVGGPEGITYLNGSAGTSSGKDLFGGVRIDKHWTFTFRASQLQLSRQLDQFRAEVEGQLTSSGCAISGRGRWSGDFSGFSFEYSSGGARGIIRVTGVSFESGRQGIDILVYEH